MNTTLQMFKMMKTDYCFDIRSTSASPASINSFPTFAASVIILCSSDDSIPRPEAAYPSVNPTDSQNTTFRFSDIEFKGNVAIAYRFVVTRISLGDASKNIVFSTFKILALTIKGNTILAVTRTGIFHQSFFGIKGTALSFECQTTFMNNIPNHRQLGKLFPHAQPDLCQGPLMLLVPRKFSPMGYLRYLYVATGRSAVQFEQRVTTHLTVEGYRSIKSSSTSTLMGGFIQHNQSTHAML